MRNGQNRKVRGCARRECAVRKYPAVLSVCCLIMMIMALTGCSAPGNGSAGPEETAAQTAADPDTAAEGKDPADAGTTGDGTDAGAGRTPGTGTAQPGEDGSGQDPQQGGSAGETGTEEAVIPEEAKKLLEDGISYYGPAEECRMTARQAEAFAEVIRTELAAAEQKHAKMEDMDPEVMYGLTPVCGAALIDAGGGHPILFVAGGSVSADTMESGSQDWERVSSWSIWQYANGAAELYQRGQEDMFGCVADQYPALYKDHLLLTVYRGADDIDRNVYRYEDGVIEKEAASFTYLRGFENDGSIEYIYVVDGGQKEKEAYDAWSGQWADDPVARFSFAGDSPEGSFSGVMPAEKMIGILTEYAAAAGGGQQGRTAGE